MRTRLADILKERKALQDAMAAGAEDVPALPSLPSLSLPRNMARACVEEQATGPYVAIEGPIRHRGPVIFDLEEMDELCRWWIGIRPEALVAGAKAEGATS